MLLERDDDLRRLERAVQAAADGEASVTLVEGAAGVGKTELLEAAIGFAVERGVRPLVARASELEHDFAFGVVRQLLEPAVRAARRDERSRLLAGAARHARPVLDLDDVPGDGELHTTLHGLYWLLANLAAGAPVLVAVDDLHWSDEASRRWLAHVARRLDGTAIALVMATRDERPVDDVDPTLRLTPGPLPLAAVGALVGATLGRDPDPAFTAACHEHTGGNPFLVSELAEAALAAGVEPTAAGAAELPALVPSRVEESVRRALRGLDADAVALAGAAAVLGDGTDLALAAEVAELELPRAADVAVTLVAARVLAEPSPVRFRHPVLRAAVEAALDDATGLRLHARAARGLAAYGAPAARVATHLLSGPPAGDPWAVGQLRTAARAARAQGVADHAVRLLRRALAEPPPADERLDVLRELGTAELAAADPAAVGHLELVRAATDDPAERAELAIALGLAHYHGGDHAAAVTVMQAAIDDAPGTAALREVRLRLEGLVALAGRYDLSTEEQVRGRIQYVAAGLEGATPAERLVRAIAGAEHPGGTAADLVRSARLEEEARGTWGWPNASEGVGIVAMYLHAGDPASGAALAERLLADASAGGSPVRYALALSLSGWRASTSATCAPPSPTARPRSSCCATRGRTGSPTRPPGSSPGC